MLLSNKVYTILKWLAQYFLPAFGTLYFALAAIWGLPYGEQVIGTITAIDLFLGTLLGISTATYNKTVPAADGELLIDSSDPQTDRYRLQLTDGDLPDLSKKKTVTFTVVPNSDLSK